MTIAHCPNCREQVSVPSGVSRQARVRCPLCSEEYLLDDALRSLPPLLVVLHDPEARASAELPESPRLGSSFAGLKVSDAPAVAMDEGSEELSFEPTSPDVAPAFKFESPAIPVARGSSVTTRPRTRRKHSSPLRMIVQTIGGGVMGLAIAQLILWWMPGKWDQNNRDPFHLAAKVSPYAPFLVPLDLRGNAPAALSDADAPAATSSRADTSSAPGDDAPPPASDGLDSKIPEFTFNANAPAESTKRPTGRNQKDQEKKEPASQPEDFPLIGLKESDPQSKASAKGSDPISPPDLTLDPIPAKPSSDEPSSVKEVKKANPPAGPGAVPAPVVAAKPMLKEPLGLRNPPEIQVEEVTARLEEFDHADLAWDSAENPPRDQKLQLITELYAKLAQLGNAVAILRSTQPEAVEPLQTVADKLSALTSQSQKLIPIGNFGGTWFRDRHDEGAALVGVVLSHQPRGKLFETQIRLNAKSFPVASVISATNLAKQLPVESNVLVLGRLVSAPARNLAGYVGDADSVLLHGVHVLVPEADPKP